MSAYVRPALDPGIFRDDDGAVIPYGRRWDDEPDGGPESTYSTAVHPERFAPLLEVARALIQHLSDVYDVGVEVEGATYRLIPAGGEAATLQLDLVEMIRCTAGVDTPIAYFCGCDHCDEDVLELATQLEDEVWAVVEGRFREWLEEVDGDLWASWELRARDGSHWQSGGGTIEDDPVGQAALRETYRAVPAQWRAWPRRPLPRPAAR